MSSYEWIGWLSSAILILTIGRQTQKEWRLQCAKGISKYLFIGQVSAELGFVIYSFLLRNWVFFSVNLFLLLENMIGLVVTAKINRAKA